MALAGIALAAIAAFALAGQSLAIRRGTTTTHGAVDVLATVFAVNCLVILPIGTIEIATTPTTLPVDAIAAFAAAGILGSLLGRACYYVGIIRLGASRAEPLKALLPLFAVAGAVLFLDEPLTLPMLAGISILVAAGAAVTLEARTSPITTTSRQFRLDISLPLLAAVLYGVDPVLTKLGLQSGTTTTVAVTVRTIAATLGFGAYLLAPTHHHTPLRTNRWLALAGLTNTIYLLTYYAALDQASVAVVTTILGSSTLFVVGGAALFLQSTERVTWRLATAAAGIVLGITIVIHG